MNRYLVSPISDENCNSVDGYHIIVQTDDLAAAKAAAAGATYPFGTGIVDRQTGLLDVGFGFGVLCPEQEED